MDRWADGQMDRPVDRLTDQVDATEISQELITKSLEDEEMIWHLKVLAALPEDPDSFPIST